ncbi:hypothetical protein GOODEAATRI_008032, partial [Goodea atripinnis]
NLHLPLHLHLNPPLFRPHLPPILHPHPCLPSVCLSPHRCPSSRARTRQVQHTCPLKPSLSRPHIIKLRLRARLHRLPPPLQLSHHHHSPAFPSPSHLLQQHRPLHHLIRTKIMKPVSLLPLHPLFPRPPHLLLSHHHLQLQRRPQPHSASPLYTWQRSRLTLPSLGRVKRKTVRVEARESFVNEMNLWFELKTSGL